MKTMSFRARLLPAAYVMLLFLAASAGFVPGAWAKEIQDLNAGSGSSSGLVVQGGDGSVDVTVYAEFTSAAVDGSDRGGATVSSQSVTASVHPVCSYEQDRTGAEVAEWIDSGQAEKETSVHGNWGSVAPYLQDQYPNYESYANDSEGALVYALVLLGVLQRR
ncbi:MAG: hypothetical protein E7Z95_04210 [Actinomyces succiniciruminis]|nr:hypothetical protein [Actinomyces succiniciruminis]